MQAIALEGAPKRKAGPLTKGRWQGRSVRTAAITYLVVMLVIPLIVIVRDGLREGIGELVRQITLPVAANALYLTFWTAGVMTLVTAIMGTLTAYVLVRYRFPGQGLLNAIVDLPLAIPTLVTGVMLVVLYGPQAALGGWLKAEWGLSIIFAPPAIILALLFVTFPFVVRAVEPVLRTLDLSQESAAATLGASGFTIFRRITLPPLILPIITGSLLSFARAIGEFGSIVIVSGNIPFATQTAAVYVLGEVESENRLGASAISLVMIGVAFSLILIVDWLQSRKQEGI